MMDDEELLELVELETREMFGASDEGVVLGPLGISELSGRLALRSTLGGCCHPG